MASSTDPLASAGGSDPIGQQFGIINGMISGKRKPANGGVTAPGGAAAPTDPLASAVAPGAGGAPPPAIGTTNPNITPQQGGDNSMTKILNDINNLLSSQGENQFQTGTNILGAGQNLTAGGTNLLGTGLSSMQPSMDYWNAILSGDPTKVQQYIAPMAQQISDSYAGAKSAADEQLPVGGGRSATMANLPFQQAGDVAKLYQGLQPTAANAIDTMANQITQTALGQENVGLGQQGVGVQEQNAGVQQIIASLQALLGQRGQNVQERGQLQAMIGQLAQAAAGG